MATERLPAEGVILSRALKGGEDLDKHKGGTTRAKTWERGLLSQVRLVKSEASCRKEEAGIVEEVGKVQILELRLETLGLLNSSGEAFRKSDNPMGERIIFSKYDF